MARNLPAALAALDEPVYVRLWVGLQCTNLSVVLVGVTAAWTMAETGRSAAQIALVQTALAVPAIFLALPAGVFADIYSRRMAMILAQVLGVLAIAALLVTDAVVGFDLFLLLGPCLLLGISTAFTTPAWMAGLGDLVPPNKLPSAVALHGMGFNLMRCIGPAVGGLLIMEFGGAWVYAVALVMALAFPLQLLRLREGRQPPPSDHPGFCAAIVNGARYVTSERLLVSTLILSFLFCMSASSVPALLAPLTQDRLGGGSFHYGLLLGGFGFGALVGGFAAPAVRQRFSTTSALIAGFFLLGLATIGLGLVPTVQLALPAVVVAGIAWLLALSCFALSMQLGSARHMIGRAMSCYYTAVYLGLGLGSWIWGALSDRLGLGWGMAGAGFVALAGLLVVLADPKK